MAEQATATAKGAMVQRNVSTRRRPAGRVAPVPSEAMTVDEIKVESKADSLRPTDEIVSDDGNKKVVRRRKKRKRIVTGPLLFLGGWAILVMLVVILMKYREGVADSENDSEEKEEDGAGEALVGEASAAKGPAEGMQIDGAAEQEGSRHAAAAGGHAAAHRWHQPRGAGARDGAVARSAGRHS